MTKILLVDDHKLFRNSLILYLSEIFKEITFLEADNGLEAVQQVQFDSSIDLVLLDIQMPK